MKLFKRKASKVEETVSLVDFSLPLSEQIDSLQVHVDNLSHDLDRLTFAIVAARKDDENTLRM